MAAFRLSPQSPLFKAWKEIRSNPLAMVCFLVLNGMIVLCVAAPLITPFDPSVGDIVDAKLIPPAFSAGGSWLHPLGTDSSGRDVLSRILYGGRLSLVIGLVPILLSSVLGIPLGLISGYAGGKIDEVLMRVTDCLLAFPSLLLALIVVSFLGPGIFNLMLAVGISNAPSFARVVRSAVMSEKKKDYVTAALAQGARTGRILVRHIVPNIMGPMIIIFTITFASVLLESAGLSFLGLGVQPPTPEWGAMLSDAKDYFYSGWWMILFPGIAILLVVMSLNILGDSLRDALDPRASRK